MVYNLFEETGLGICIDVLLVKRKLNTMIYHCPTTEKTNIFPNALLREGLV